MNTAYLELTRFSNDNPMGYDDFPRFDKNIWPTFVQNASVIDTVYVCKYSTIWKRLFRRGAKPEVINIGDLKILSAAQRNEIKQLSNYGGHLDVFYKVKDDTFLCSLIRMWMRPATMGKDIAQLGLDHTKEQIIEGLVSTIPVPYVLLSFGHDADPLYIIGDTAVLSQLCKNK